MKRLHTYAGAMAMLVSLQAVSAGISDTTVQLHTVTIDTIRTKRAGDDQGNAITMVDFKDADGRKASEILSDFSGIYLKNYGVGQLSSISLKGGSAAQTEVQWNGIKMNNPNTGQVDLSLFDIAAGDRLTISDRGSRGTSVGGVVDIGNDMKLARNTALQWDNTVRMGSFGEHVVSSRALYRSGRFTGSTRVGYLGADNDFTFKKSTLPDAPSARQTNAATRLLSVMQQFQYTFRKGIVFGADLWLTDADRQLSPVISVDGGSERQWDRSYRAMLHVGGKEGKFSYSIRSAYLYDRMRYLDSATAIDSRSVSHALRNILTAKYVWLGSVTLAGRAHYDREMAISSGYDRSWARDLYGLAAELRYDHSSGFNASGSVGVEMQGSRPLPLPASFAVGLRRKFKAETLIISLSGAHAYRLPGLNDLYWSAGGNPDLRPEKAWKSDLELGYMHSYWLNFMANGFYNYVKDWIQWSPESGSAIWTAQNLKRVVSRGATLELKMQSKPDMNTKGFAASGGLSYSYTNTISLDSSSANDKSRGKQLIYVPLHNLSTSIRLQYRRFYVQVSQSYTGLRFITTDDSQALKPYYLLHLEVGKDLYLKAQRLGLAFRINNITNQEYQLVSQRPMAGRSFEGILRINLSK